jgi:DNA replication protein DnaC
MSREQANLFFRVMVRCYERASTSLISNPTFGSWDGAFVVGVLTVSRSYPAPLDRCQRQRRELQAQGQA